MKQRPTVSSGSARPGDAHPARASAYDFTKSACLAESMVWQGVEQVGQGSETGGWIGGEPRVGVAAGCTIEPPALHTTRQMRDALARQLGRVDVGVRRTRSVVVETEVQRARWEFHAAQVLIGPPPIPLWVRATCARGSWPEGWTDAVEREVRGWSLPSVCRPPSSIVWLDLFAVADLLRWQAASWMASAPRPDAPVTAPSIFIDDAPLVGHGTSDPIVQQGRWLQAPRREVRRSWRDRPRAQWRGLELRCQEERAWTRQGCFVTRLVSGSGGWNAWGIAMDGRPVARWGPIGVPGPAWWLERVIGAGPQQIHELTGLPVRTPLLAIDAPRFADLH